MSKRKWVISVCALLMAGPAQSGEIYAKVGSWEISAQPASHRCLMLRSYFKKAGKKTDDLTVLYAADKEGVLLIWSNDWMTYLPTKGELELGLAFRKGKSVDQSWGSRSLHYDKVGNRYLFTRAFTSAEDAHRILGDLAGNGDIGLFLGPTLLSSLPLNASDAVEKLRECARNGGRAQ